MDENDPSKLRNTDDAARPINEATGEPMTENEQAMVNAMLMADMAKDALAVLKALEDVSYDQVTQEQWNGLRDVFPFLQLVMVGVGGSVQMFGELVDDEELKAKAKEIAERVFKD